jgi:hypothetical protein
MEKKKSINQIVNYKNYNQNIKIKTHSEWMAKFGCVNNKKSCYFIIK